MLGDTAERMAESRKLAFTDTEVTTETMHRNVKKCLQASLSAAFVLVFAVRSGLLIIAVVVVLLPP